MLPPLLSWDGMTAGAFVALPGWTIDVWVVSSILFFFRYLFGCHSRRYFECHPVKTNHRLSAAARLSHPPHGLIPTAEVARLMTSPSPTSFSVIKPGSRIR
jgi:hypothetical protein